MNSIFYFPEYLVEVKTIIICLIMCMLSECNYNPGYNNWDHPWWTASNRNNSYPSTSYFDERFSGIQCRSFLKVQDISLSYRFNHSLLKRLNIESLKVYSSIQNLYTFTGWEGGDPEQGVQAMSDTYPVPAIYTIGLDISF